jgi:hypothetical protein
MSAVDIVRSMHPKAESFRNFLEADFVIWSGPFDDPTTTIIGSAVTEGAAWEDAASALLAKALK